MSTKNTNPLGLKAKDFSVTGTKITAVKGLYEAKRPDTIDPEQEKLIADYKADFTASITAVGGQLAVEAMLSDDDIDRMTVIGSMAGRNEYKATVKRSAQYPGGPNTTDKITKYAPMTISIKEDHGNAKNGLLALARKEILDLGASKLKG
jgi:hypothetical protein